mmetsp:Transcript_19018/g.56582  ORF Transcript_19018/g.56582 Transcript_19018/m.56582 type:complete len:217 (-) Transcript_19018:420-1070(-)
MAVSMEKVQVAVAVRHKTFGDDAKLSHSAPALPVLSTHPHICRPLAMARFARQTSPVAWVVPRSKTATLALRLGRGASFRPVELRRWFPPRRSGWDHRPSRSGPRSARNRAIPRGPRRSLHRRPGSPQRARGPRCTLRGNHCCDGSRGGAAQPVGYRAQRGIPRVGRGPDALRVRRTPRAGARCGGRGLPPGSGCPWDHRLHGWAVDGRGRCHHHL